MTGKKLRWWWILLPVLVAVIILTAIFWETIVIYAAPKLVLSTALTEAADQLDERFRLNPLRNVLDLYSPEGQYTAFLEMETSSDLLGDISCDLTVNTDAVSHQFMADGTVGFAGKDLSMSLYLNEEYMAVSSRELVNGKYYGITYDTFSEDMNHFPLIKPLIPAATMEKWESSLENIRRQMGRSYEMPQISEEDFRLLLAGILLLDSQVSREVWDGQECHCITYGAGGSEVKALLDYVLDTSASENSQITASFYLRERRLAGVEIYGAAGENTIRYVFSLGDDPLRADLRLTENRQENSRNRSSEIFVATKTSGAVYQEDVLLSVTEEDVATKREVVYSWDSNTGDMTLSWNNGMPMRLNMTRNTDGLRIVTEDFAQLLHILTGQTGITQKDISGSMILKPGEPLEAPEYTNLDRWSAEDLLTLLKGFGALIGFPF